MPQFDLKKEIEYRNERLKGLYQALERCENIEEAEYIQKLIKEQRDMLAYAKEHLANA